MKATVAEMEEAAFASWRAEETVETDGWVLRSARGFSRRLNSVAAQGPSERPLDEKLDAGRVWYERRGLSLVFRMTPLVDPAIGPFLAASGFVEEGRTVVLEGPLPEVPAPEGLSISDEPDPTWIDAQLTFAGVAGSRAGAWAAIIGRVPAPAAFATCANDGAVAAVGFGVVSGGLLGVFELVVDPARRRMGFGRKVMEGLFVWGREMGARRTYLQVVAANRPAVALYQGFGLATGYEYHYLREQRSPVVADAVPSP